MEEDIPEFKFSRLDKVLDPIKAFKTMLIPAYQSYNRLSINVIRLINATYL